MIIFALLSLVYTLTNLTWNSTMSNLPELLYFNDSSYQITQSVYNFTMFINPYISDASNYFNLEQSIYESRIYTNASSPTRSRVAFAASLNKLPSISGNLLTADYVDWNGYYGYKNYSQLLIPPQNYFLGDQIFVSVLILPSPSSSPWNYYLKIRRQLSPSCPQNCLSPTNGQCSLSGLVCGCGSGFIDLDCSVYAQPLYLGNPLYNQQLTTAQPVYYYYQMTTRTTTGVTIRFQISTSQSILGPYYVTCYALLENYILGVPNNGTLGSNTSIVLSQAQTADTFNINTTNLQFNTNILRNQRVLIAVYTTQAIQIDVQVYPTGSNGGFDTNMLLIYFLVSLAVVLIFTWAIITYVKYRQARSRVQDVQVRRRRNSIQHLTQKIIDKYMPIMLYRNIYDQRRFKIKKIERAFSESCSVCLLEFEDENLCRSTPCLHVFHSDCLCQWLLKHENCPNCRTELGEKDLLRIYSEEEEFQKKINKPRNAIGQIDNDFIS